MKLHGLDLPSGPVVYVVRCWGGLVKIGHSSDLRARLRQLGTGVPGMSLAATYSASSVGDAKVIERAAHTALRRFRLGRSEWFRPSLFVAKVVRAVEAGRPMPKDPFYRRVSAVDPWKHFRRRREAARSYRAGRAVEKAYFRELSRVERRVARQIEHELRRAA